MSVPQIVRKNTGMGFREAARYCAKLNLSKVKTAEFMGIDRVSLYRWLDHFGIKDIFPTEKKDMAQDCQGGPEPGGCRLDRRKPIYHNGVVWYPGEPTHHCLFSIRQQ